MDAEGAEPLIFRGMQRLLDANRRLSVFCEFAPDLVRGAGEDPRDFLGRLQAQGFRIQHITTDSRVVDIRVEDALGQSHCELLLQRS